MQRLDPIPRLGWADDPSPVTDLADLGVELRLGGLWVKRDDALGPLHGSTKTRKLDYLLAAEPWASADRLASIGAIGSGHLTALVSAGNALGKQIDVHVFFEPLSRGVEDNLAYTARGAAHLRYAGGPVRLALRYPALVLGSRLDGAVVVPAGGTVPEANVGLVRAGLELAEQVRAGLLPEPSRIYVALGSGGTSVGLAVGLALAGLSTEVHGVDVVGRPVVSRRRLRGIRRRLVNYLRAGGVALPAGFSPPLPVIRRGFLGGGYGLPSQAGTAAAERLRAEGVPAEDVYTGKAFACLLADAPKLPGASLLFWMTARSDDPLLAPAEVSPGAHRAGPWQAAQASGWRDALPEALARRLERDPSGALALRRRRFLALAGGLGFVAASARRLTGYPFEGPWRGHVLSRREGRILAAAAEALVPDVPGEPLSDGPSWFEVAANIDRYLLGMSRTAQREIHGLLALVEQGTLLGGAATRLTRLAPAKRRQTLESMAALDPLLAVAVRGLRDLCMLGTWQDERRWAAIGYTGPTIEPIDWQFSRGRDGRPRPTSRYDHLLAPPGAIPEEEA